MMRTYLIILFAIIISSCSNDHGKRESLDYDKVEITFKGQGDYKVDGELHVSVTDSTAVQKLNQLKNKSESIWFGESNGKEYVIKLVYVNTKTKDKLLLHLLKGTESDPILEYGIKSLFDGTYENQELVNYVNSLINLEAIKNHKGSLNQAEYDRIR